jgi:hypothetical protein
MHVYSGQNSFQLLASADVTEFQTTDAYSSLDLTNAIYVFRMSESTRMRWAEHVARLGEKRNAYRIVVGKPERKRPLRRPRRRWVDNIKMDVRDIG